MSKIASIYFAPVRAERIFGGPYEMPAVPLGADPVILEITDRIQIEQGPYTLSSDNSKRSRRRHIVTSEAIARDLVNEWAYSGVGMTPQCRPGIWVVREQVPLFHQDGTQQTDADGLALWEPAGVVDRTNMFEEDLEAARAADRAYANALFIRGNGMAEDPRLIPFIPLNSRRAAKHYGLDAEWLKEDAALNVKPCPYCTKIIPGKAIKCPKCAEIVDVEAYVRLEIEKQAALKLAKEALRSSAA
jgi:hypothetical protein